MESMSRGGGKVPAGVGVCSQECVEPGGDLFDDAPLLFLFHRQTFVDRHSVGSTAFRSGKTSGHVGRGVRVAAVPVDDFKCVEQSQPRRVLTGFTILAKNLKVPVVDGDD